MTARSSDQWSIQSTNVIITAILIMLSSIIIVFVPRGDSEGKGFLFRKKQWGKGVIYSPDMSEGGGKEESTWNRE